MKPITIEEAFELRARLNATTGKFSPEKTVIQNILYGEYERIPKGIYDKSTDPLEAPIDIAKEDLAFLKEV